MNTVVEQSPTGISDRQKRTLVMLASGLLPFTLSILLAAVFYLIGEYRIVELVPAKTEFGSIDFPVRGKAVGDKFTTKGTLSKLTEEKIAYLMVKRDGHYWPKKYLGSKKSSWSKEITEPKKKKSKLNVVILSMSDVGKKQIDQWYATAKKTGKYPGMAAIEGAEEIAVVEVKQK